MIAGVIVTYNPDAETFIALLRRIATQLDRLYVVDNSDQDNNDAFRFLLSAGVDLGRVSLVRLGQNLGIAVALNVGMENALQEGASFVLLSDQDSLPEKDMVLKLLAAYRDLGERGENVGAVGPTFTDVHTGLTYSFQARVPGQLFYGHRSPTSDEPHVQALTLITSGTLMPAHVLRDVGLMREDFFIDQVDIEWGHRARSKGYQLFGTGWAGMSQRMGEECLRVWYLRWRRETAYSPLRIYFRLRNFVALCSLDFIDLRWKLRNGWYCLGIVYAHVCFGPRPMESLQMACCGVWHGLRRKMGPYQQ